MNENNYIKKTSFEFIEILDGKQSYFYIPQTANLRASYQMTNQALAASGLDVISVILVPTMRQRLKEYVRHDSQHIPREHWPDFNDPLVYTVTGETYWYRGMNISSGEGPKPELDLGVDLLKCEFDRKFSISNVTYKGSLRIDKCVF